VVGTVATLDAELPTVAVGVEATLASKLLSGTILADVVTPVVQSVRQFVAIACCASASVISPHAHRIESSSLPRISCPVRR
jgi:hypothetical protein